MTSETTSPYRLTKVDASSLPDHSYLAEDDPCYFLGEYTARKGYAYSNTNRLILNFKKSVDRIDLPEWKYKTAAIRQAAEAFRAALAPLDQTLKELTFVPIPPSRAKDDPLYDDRVTQMLDAIHPDLKLDIREILVQVHSTTPVHLSEARPSPGVIAAGYELDEGLAIPNPNLIVIVDDLLTTGAHYRAAQTLLSSRFPSAYIMGLFLARRVPDTSDFDDFDW